MARRLIGCKLRRMDADLQAFSRAELAAEVRKLRAGIRAHRDRTKHELCWHHPELWSLLPEKLEPDVAVPAWPQFLQGCVRYRESLDQELPRAPRTTEPFRGPDPKGSDRTTGPDSGVGG